MKKYTFYILTALTLITFSCRKIEYEQSQKPVLVKVEAIHTTGEIVTSQIILIK